MTYYNYRGQPMPESATESGRIAGTAAGAETMVAPAGDTSVSGEGGGDLLIGSAGDNRFWITDPNDTIQESANAGVDTEIGWTSLKLADNVENLQVNGAFNYALGNSLNNLIVVDDNQHWLYGGAGDDVLVGAATTKSTFIVKAGEGNDVIYNWNGESQLQLLNYGFTSVTQVRSAMTQQGADVVLNLPTGESLTIRDAVVANIQDRQLLLPLDATKLGAMTFDDEFDSLSLYDPSHDTGTWQTNFGGNLKDQWAYTLVSNGETEAYVAPGYQGRGEGDIGVNPFSVANGVVTITAAPVSSEDAYATWNRDYTSGMLNTLGSFQQKYGYFEMRAELPAADGAWPAFWLMPNPYVSGVEADILEGLGKQPSVDHVRAADGSGGELYDDVPKLDAEGFHTYGLLWTPTTVTFYLDGTAILTGATPASWTQPMALIVNLATGGWGGTTDAADFPAQMKIDYVHVYALADGSSQVVHTDPTPPVATLREDGGITSGQAAISETFSANALPISSAHIAVAASHPDALPAGQTFMIWEDAGAVYGAVSNGASLATPTVLMAGAASQFSGAGTWLTDGKVVFSYMQANGTGGQDAWAMVFDPQHLTFTRQDLGAATGGVAFVATDQGGFAVSWHAPDGTVMARGYDEYAYGGDIPGWYGPARVITGDLVGVAANGDVIANAPGGQQLYDLLGATVTTTPGATTGDDQIQASSALQEIHAAAGDDTILGWSGQDYLRGDDGNDSIAGGSAFDDINGNMGNDTAHGNAGNDWVVGGKDADALYGDDGDDIVYGNIGDDTCDGGAGADLIRGGQNDDVLSGGDGNDWLSGDLGSDTITGGAGADTFHTFATAGLDRVTDFSTAEGDRVQVDAGSSYTLSQQGADTVIDFGGGNEMVLVGVQLSTLPSGWIFTL